MFELIVGLALLPVAIIVGFFLIALAFGLLWLLGGPLLAITGAVLMANQVATAGIVCLVIGLCWTAGVAAYSYCEAAS